MSTESRTTTEKRPADVDVTHVFAVTCQRVSHPARPILTREIADLLDREFRRIIAAAETAHERANRDPANALSPTALARACGYRSTVDEHLQDLLAALRRARTSLGMQTRLLDTASMPLAKSVAAVMTNWARHRLEHAPADRDAQMLASVFEVSR